MSETPNDVFFDEETKGVLVAGRAIESGDLTRAQIGAFAAAVQRLGEAHTLTLEMVPSGDMSTRSGPPPDSKCYATMVIGIRSAEGGTSAPDPISRDGVLSSFATANTISLDVWKEIAALLPEGARAALLDQQTAVHLVCVGQAPAAYLAFGVLSEEEDGGNGEYLRGQDMDQDSHASGIWGQQVGYVQAEGPDELAVDFSEAAHQARVASFPEGQYFLIGCYDCCL
jgi:hypothetical protein